MLSGFHLGRITSGKETGHFLRHGLGLLAKLRRKFHGFSTSGLGIEKERTRVEWVSAAEGARFSEVMNDFVKKITELGENRRITDLRVKEQ